MQLEQLLELRRESDVRAQLGKLPLSLERAYDELIADIRAQPGSAPTIAERAFAWVMCARRPLTPAELVAAVCHDPESDAVGPVDVDIRFVLASCRNLIALDPVRHTRRFAHLSMLEYVQNRVWGASNAHALVAKTCLELLLAQSSDRPAPPLSAGAAHGTSALGTSALLAWKSKPGASDEADVPYAVQYCEQHVQCCGADPPDSRLALLLKNYRQSMERKQPKQSSERGTR